MWSPRTGGVFEEPVLEVRNLSRKGKPNLRGISFTLHRGEILGFAGLVGAGRSETARADLRRRRAGQRRDSPRRQTGAVQLTQTGDRSWHRHGARGAQAVWLCLWTCRSATTSRWRDLPRMSPGGLVPRGSDRDWPTTSSRNCPSG